MGWGSILKNAGKIGAIAAAPFTGGSSLMALPMIDGLAGMAGKGLTANSQQAANNRDAKYSGQMDLASMLMQRDLARLGLEGQADRDFNADSLAREKDGRESGSDAWKKLMAAQRTLSPSARPQVAGKYSVAPRQATDVERQGADAMSAEVMSRLQGGNALPSIARRDTSFQYDPMSTIDPNLMNAGRMETAGNWLGPILSYLGNMRQPQPGDVSTKRTPPIMPPQQAGLSSPGVYRRT